MVVAPLPTAMPANDVPAACGAVTVALTWVTAPGLMVTVLRESAIEVAVTRCVKAICRCTVWSAVGSMPEVGKMSISHGLPLTTAGRCAAGPTSEIWSNERWP